MLLNVISSLLCSVVGAQSSPPALPLVAARQTFYTDEATGDVIFDLGPAKSAHIKLEFDHKVLAERDVTGPGVGDVAFPLATLPVGQSTASCTISLGAGPQREVKFEVVRLAPKPNAVKVDRLTGAFKTDGLPLFPFGFYCYSPVQTTLPEEEFVRGFSMISPYQDLATTKPSDRRAYMDRCADLGMKVNYSLVSVSGGGSGTQLSESDRHKRQLLADEVRAFKDHPALLAWYLSDEPDGENVSPHALEEEYQLVKQLDPYHPVLMVFNTPPKAPLFKKALDVAMADPYPIPDGSPVEVGTTIAGLRAAFGIDKPLWVVPQAFGGNEWWSREPTRQEIRLMTWQSILNGASGVQFFVRHGLGAFPKSPSMWAECGMMAEEVFELEPFLHSTESAPTPTVDVSTVQARCWRLGTSLLLAVVNKANAPTAMTVQLGTTAATAHLPFENRNIPISGSKVADLIDGYGTRFYVLDEGVEQPTAGKNPIIDPGFELSPTPGVPSSCYFGLGSDRGATARIDPRVAHSGRHSVRLIAPSDSAGLTLSFYPVALAPGHTYHFSVWAKAQEGSSPRLELSTDPAGSGSTKAYSFSLTSEWRQYRLVFHVPPGKDPVRTSATVRLASKGVAWIDDLDIEGAERGPS